MFFLYPILVGAALGLFLPVGIAVVLSVLCGGAAVALMFVGNSAPAGTSGGIGAALLGVLLSLVVAALWMSHFLMILIR